MLERRPERSRHGLGNVGSVGSELASSAQLKQFEIGGFGSFEVKLEPAVSDDVLWPEMTLFIPTWSETVSDNDSLNPLPNLVLISRLAGECGVSAEKSVGNRRMWYSICKMAYQCCP